MCKENNVIHNFYHQHHTIDKFDVEVQERSTPKTSPIKAPIQPPALIRKIPSLLSVVDKLVENVVPRRPAIQSGVVDTIYDIRTVKINYGSTVYKKQKLADILMPPYIAEAKYLDIIHHLKDFFDQKTVSILQISDEYVYLYYDGECVNTMINNWIVYNLTN